MSAHGHRLIIYGATTCSSSRDGRSFFRSFLYRYLVKANFQSVPLNQFLWMPFVATSLIFGFEHQEWLSGFPAGSRIKDWFAGRNCSVTPWPPLIKMNAAIKVERLFGLRQTRPAMIANRKAVGSTLTRKSILRESQTLSDEHGKQGVVLRAMS